MTSDTVHEERGEAETRSPERVRIVGAERAGDVVARTPEGPGPDGEPGSARGSDAGPGDGEMSDAGFGEAAGREAGGEDDWKAEEWPVPAEPQLPHWTEAPTGEVPAVLSRGGETGEEDPWASLPEPTWREERHDWEQEESIAPSLLGGPGDEPTLISEPDEEVRQPWSFELGTEASPSAEDVEARTGDLGGLGTGDLFGAWAPLAGVDAGEVVGDFDETDEIEIEIDEIDIEIDEVEIEEVDAGESTTVMHFAGHASPQPEHEPDEDWAARGALADAEPGPPGRAASRPRLGRRHGEHADAAALAADAAADAAAGSASRHPTAVRPPTVSSRPVARRTPPAPHRSEDALSQRTGRDIPAAVVSGVVIGGLALLAFHFGTVPSMVVVTLVLTAAAVEAYAAFRAAYRPATLLGIAAVAGVIVGTYDKPFVALPVVVVLLVAATFGWHLVGVDRRADPVRSTAATLVVFCWVGVFGSYAALLLAPTLFPHRTGIAYLLGALIAAVAYDVGALVVGAWVGRHPLSRVSPGKTWEGVAGGAVAAIVFAVAIVHLVHPWTLGEAALLGVVVAVVSPIGDLCESLVKRHLGLKDMGRILPGHGGLLDRVDGLLFVLPAAYYLVRAFGHG